MVVSSKSSGTRKYKYRRYSQEKIGRQIDKLRRLNPEDLSSLTKGWTLKFFPEEGGGHLGKEFHLIKGNDYPFVRYELDGDYYLVYVKNELGNTIPEGRGLSCSFFMFNSKKRGRIE